MQPSDSPKETDVFSVKTENEYARRKNIFTREFWHAFGGAKFNQVLVYDRSNSKAVAEQICKSLSEDDLKFAKAVYENPQTSFSGRRQTLSADDPLLQNLEHLS